MKTSLRRLCPKCLFEKPPSPRMYMILVLIILGSMTFLWQTIIDLMQIRLFRCYNQGGNILVTLDESNVPLGKSFFFHETSCAFEDNIKDIRLNARQACAVESTALHHPDNSVYLLIVAPVFKQLDTTSNKAVQGLIQYPNIKIRHINLFSYVKTTPIRSVLKALRRSQYPVSHTSDVLRYTTLSKFRGTYMDLDVIVLKPLLNRTNFVGAESVRSLGAGIINFGPDEIGQTMAHDCAHELIRTFDGDDWGMNGPGVITRVLQRKCPTRKVGDWFDKDCQGFHVYSVPNFYAFPFWEASMFFKPYKLAQVQKLVNSSSVIHYWNKVTAAFKLPEDKTKVPFLYYARNNCPSVYKAVNGSF